MSQSHDSNDPQVTSLSLNSKDTLKVNKQLGCYYCQSQFDYTDIQDFVNVGETALCPVCDIDAVIPLDDVVESERDSYLTRLNKRFFT